VEWIVVLPSFTSIYTGSGQHLGSLGMARLSQGLVALHKCQNGTTLRESLVVPEFLNVNLLSNLQGKMSKNRPFGFFLENSAHQ
jgi:hypothetical protein